jgi:hypothetical protein
VRERRRVRFDSKTPVIVQPLTIYPLPLPKGEARRNAPTWSRIYIEHNILWLGGPGTPSNCVIFLL